VLNNVKIYRRVALIFLAMLAIMVPASAHPHMWVTYELTVDYDKGAVTGVDHAWSFDDAYAAMALEGLDTNNDGKYDQHELADLLKVNMDGLKEFNYFTVAKLGDADLKFKPPVDYWLEYNAQKILTLHFTLPLEKPVPAEATGFAFSVSDPSYFIDFELAKEHPVTLGRGAPAGCVATIHDPAEEDEDSQKLNQAFSNALGNKNGTSGFGLVKSVAVRCAKS
jgi:ABC-type uncharacterized transport system substrate-binding protein